ncbi:tetratricopeptide repeat protein [Desulfobulbus alkaliphilus]|uniref:tetratricopeptide repeat protein n=1 Tax=Desulfobulbus alkaliphilus TaxID=869814 RepID=UPI0019636420|nr:tetratricopeptide repeat protein [Desulfobulbus alkaliphilus]MBM9537277.1 tetratricopeptide repeat protein [Desulfobulbus alkaliphilus]
MINFVLAAVGIIVVAAIILALKLRTPRKRGEAPLPDKQVDAEALQPRETIQEPEESTSPSGETVDGLDASDVKMDESPVLAHQEGEVLAAVSVETDSARAGEGIEDRETASAAAVPVEQADVEALEEIRSLEIGPETATAEEPAAPEEKIEPVVPKAAVEEPETSAVVAEAEADLKEETTAGQVRFSLQTYANRLNDLEEKQRAALARLVGEQNEKHRDRMQRELVIMNDKLALLEDSYAEEVASCGEILQTLAEMPATDFSEQQEAMANLREGDPEKAEALLVRLSQQEHPLAARAGYHSGQLAEFRVELQTALDRYRQALEREPENAMYLRAAGRAARSLYRYKEALAWFATYVRLCREKSDADPLDLALAQRELAYTLMLSGQYQKAGALYKEAMAVMARKLGQDHPEMATCWYQIGEFQETMGEYDKAVSLYRKALAILEQTKGQEHPALAVLLDKLAALCMELEMEKEAVPLYERLLRIREQALRPTHPQLALSLNNLAESYRLQGQYLQAEACYQKSLHINETLHGPEHPSVAAILQELAKLCTSQRKTEEARQYQERASAIFQKSVDASERKSGKEALTLEL